MSPRWLLLILFIWLINLPINNWLESGDFITSAQESAFNNTQNYTFDSSVDTDGVESLNISKPQSAIETMFDAASYNYTFFYDVDPLTGDNTPNQFMIIRWILIITSLVVIVFSAKTLFFK